MLSKAESGLLSMHLSKFLVTVLPPILQTDGYAEITEYVLVWPL